MPVQWSVEDVDKMAPDGSSISAGRKLSQAKQWLTLGASAFHLWGELKGSGSKPYQTSIDLTGPAFHCSCPSRKIPCKHVLGLAYIYAESPAALTSTQPPEWLEEWINKRAEREERKQARATSAAQPVDEVSAERRAKEQEKRSKARFDKASAGIAFISQWLLDAVRHGLATTAEHPFRYWDELAARTVDAQIPGLARQFRHLSALRHARAHWQGPFLDKIAYLNLLCTAFEKYETLEADWRADIEAALGFTQNKDDLPTTDAVSDQWSLLGSLAGEEEGLRYQRTWLYGQNSNRTALLLDFAAKGQLLPNYGQSGDSFSADLIFYPSAWPQRALLKQRGEPLAGMKLPSGLTRLDTAQESYVAAVEKLPWIERIVVTLSSVKPASINGDWLIVDAAGDALPLSPNCRNGWELLSMSAGHPVDLVCEFDGETLLPISIADADGVRSLPAGNSRIEESSPALYPLWQQTLATVLLGADRQHQPVAANGPLGAALGQIYSNGILPAEAEARSHALLQAVTLLSLYRKAAQPPRHGITAPEPCPGDATPQASELAASHLRQLLESRDLILLNEWMALAAGNKRHCPHALLPSLLDVASSSRSVYSHLKEVLGLRGGWLAERKEAWRNLFSRLHSNPEVDLIRLWEEGGNDERCTALQWMHAQNPDDARERLIAVFAKEPATVRATFLSALRDNLSMNDAEFLQSCLADKSQEVRLRAAELLTLLPDSGYTHRLQERADRWISFKGKTGLLSGMSSKKGSIEVTLPEAWEPALRGEGLIEKPPSGKGAKAWWLEQTLTLVAPRHWLEQWQLSPADCLALLDGHEWRDALLTGWVNATLLHCDQGWALALLAATDLLNLDSATRQRLWPVIPSIAREKLATEIFATHQVNLISDAIEALQQLETSSSETLSRQVIDALRFLVDTAKGNIDYRTHALLRAAATQLSCTQLEYFEKSFARELEDDTPWKKVMSETRARLAFRAAMRSALSE